MLSKLQQFKERIPPLLILQVRKNFGLVSLSFFLLSGIISIVSWFFLRSWRIERNRIPNITSQFRIGYREISDLDYLYFERPEEEQKIKPLLSNLSSGLFYLVTGSEGCGKTSLIKHCIRNKEGVIYFSAPSEPEEFSRQLAQTLNYNMTSSNMIVEYLSQFPSFSPKLSPSAVLNMTLDALSQACASFKSSNLYPPTLIIDNFNLSTNVDYETFKRLISFAKEEADSKRLNVIFVVGVSQGDIVQRISAAQRSRMEIIEIEDLSQESAKSFFNYYVKEVPSDEVIAVTGGRMIHLVKAIDMLRKKRVSSVEQMRMKFLDEAYNKLADARLIIPPLKKEKQNALPHLQQGIVTMMKIYDSPTKSLSYRELIQDLRDTSSLTHFNGNIFFRSYTRNQVGLESKALELCVGELMGERDTHTRREFAEIFLPPPNE